jgi:hypothetical protein
MISHYPKRSEKPSPVDKTVDKDAGSISRISKSIDLGLETSQPNQRMMPFSDTHKRRNSVDLLPL